MSFIQFNTTKTLRELEQKEFMKVNFNSNLVNTCCDLYNKKPVGKYNTEDLRIMIGQRLGLQYLIPIAIEDLQQNIFIQGTLYAGDLLSSILSVENTFWKKYPNLKNKMKVIIKENIEVLNKALQHFN